MAEGIKLPDSLIKTLGADLPPLPYSDTGSVQNLRTKMSEAERQASEASTKATQAGEREATLRKEKSAEYAPVMEKMGKRIEEEQGKTVAPLEALPELQQTQISPEQTKEAFTTFLTFAMLGGALTRQPMLAAMNNMTAAMKGWQEGDTARTKAELESFDRNFKIAQAKRSGQIEERKAAHEKYKGDIQGLELAEKQIALKYEDQIAAELARKGDFNALSKHYDSLAKNYETAIHHANQVEQQNRRLAETEKRDQQRHQQMMAKLSSGGGEKALSPYGKVAQDEGLKPGTQQYQDRVKQLEGEKAAAGKGGAVNTRLAYSIAENFGQATADLVNVATVPEGTVLSAFNDMAGKSGESLTSAARNTFSRNMTSEDARVMGQLVAGLETSMARVLGGGYASSSTRAIMDLYKSQIPREGDSAMVTAAFLARIKQELGIVAKNFKEHPGATKGQIEMIKDYMDEINQVVPFDVKTVRDALRGSRSTLTKQSTDLLNMPSTNNPLPQGREQTTPASDDAQKAQQAFGSYEPNKYTYGINPATGKFARKLLKE